MVHKNYLFLLLGITALGLIAFSPAIYAAIEPHITIMMDSGQSTNPFQIKDDLNNDVFSIDTNGQIFPEQHWKKELTYRNAGEIVYSHGFADLPTDTSFAHEGVLAQWKVDFSGYTVSDFGEQFHYANSDSNISHQVMANHTSGFCAYEVDGYSTFSGGWGNGPSSLGAGCSSSNCGSYNISFDDYQHDELFDTEYIRLIVYADVTPATECTTRELDAYFPIIVPPDVIVTRQK